MEIIDKLYIKSKTDFKSATEILLEMFPKGEHYCVGSTYNDKECLIENSYFRRRTFPTLFKVCKTYLPELTRDEMIAALIEAKLRCYICPNIMRVVFHRAPPAFLCDEKLYTADLK